MKLPLANRTKSAMRITRAAARQTRGTRHRLHPVLAWIYLVAAAVPTGTEAQEADIPDESLRAAIERALDKQSGETITVEEMESLTELQANYLGIKDLTGLEHATELTELMLWSNEIVDLAPLSDLTALETLRLSRNRIADVTPLAGLTSLTLLGLPFNNVSDPSPLAGLEALESLDLRDNRISDLAPLSGLDAMEWLLLGDNGVTDLSPLSGLTTLDRLGLSNNEIVDLAPLANLSVLRILELSNNGITDLSPLAGLVSSLRFLELGSNGISDLSPLAGLTDLASLDLSNNRITDVASLEGMQFLWDLDLDDNRISDLAPLAGMTRMSFLYLSENEISDLSPLTGMNELDYLHLSNNELADLMPLVDLDTLSVLTLSGNRISDLTPLSDLKLLAVLHLADNQIWDLSPLSDLPEMTFLFLSGNAISDLSPLSDLPELLTLDLSDNDISDVSSLSGTPAFQIYLADNQISDVAPLRGGYLLELDLSRNGMSDVSSLSGLLVGELVLSDNEITNISPLSGVPFTVFLDLSDNQISDVSALSRLELWSLDLSNNRMTDLSAVEGVRSLRTLDAAVNEIVDIGPAANLPSLQSLDLGGNAVADAMPLASAPASLGSVSLWANPLDADSRDVHIPAMRELGVRLAGGGWRVPFFPAPGGFRQGFVRVVSSVVGEPPSGQDASDRAWIFASGQDGSPSRFLLGARNARHFNSDDLVSGNPSKGLRSTIESEAGDRLSVYAADDLEVLSYIRTADGFVTSMHDTAAWLPPGNERLDALRGRAVAASDRTAGGHFVPTFNPASNTNQRSRLRLVNPSGEDTDVTVYAVDDHGVSADPVRFSLDAHSTRTLDATELESGAADLSGSLGDGEGKWRLVVSADAAIHVMNLMSSPTGHLTNLSTSSDALVVPMFPAASHPTQQGFARVANLGGTAGTARIRGYDDAGASYGPLLLELPAGRTVHFNSDDWEFGNAEKGLEGAAGTGEGPWRLEFESTLDLAVSAYVRTRDGFLTSMHDHVVRDTCAAEEVEGGRVAARSERTFSFRDCGDERRVPFFNPASNTRQVSSLRLVNRGDSDAAITIFGVDDDGAERGPAMLSLPAGTARTLTSLALESGDGESLAGALGDGTGKWELRVFVAAESAADVMVMNLLESPTGHLTNLSTWPDEELRLE